MRHKCLACLAAESLASDPKTAQNSAMVEEEFQQDAALGEARDHVIDDVIKAARHLQSLLPEVKGRISRPISEDLNRLCAELGDEKQSKRHGSP